jgi:hypothetical protein
MEGFALLVVIDAMPFPLIQYTLFEAFQAFYSSIIFPVCGGFGGFVTVSFSFISDVFCLS